MKMPNIAKYLLPTLMALSMFAVPLGCASADNAQIKPFTFAQICDTQLGFSKYEADIQAFEQAVKQINELNPDFVVIAGDLVNVPGEKAYEDFSKIRSGFKMPCYCVPGNHDIGNKTNPKKLKNYRDTVGRDYYSVNHKGYVFVFVNTQLWKSPLPGETRKQDAWLEKTLKEAKKAKRPVFIVGHIPMFLENHDEKDAYFNIPIKDRKRLLKLFKDSGVVAVLTGHRHLRIINEYKGIQMVTGESTSMNFDHSPKAFFLWRVDSPKSITYKPIPLELPQATSQPK